MYMSFIDRNGQAVDVAFEKEEQSLVRTYIPRDATVLEMGARYGTVSCVISDVLDDPTRHVAVEPDTTVIEALTENRDKNGGAFNIFEGVVSRRGYKMGFIDPTFDYYEYGTYTKPSDEPDVKNISLGDLEDMYNIRFDCIVADCEGFFYDFVKENEDCLDRMRVIIYEQDGTPWADMIDKYKELDTILESHGFTLVHTVPHPVYTNNPRLHCVWVTSTV